MRRLQMDNQTAVPGDGNRYPTEVLPRNIQRFTTACRQLITPTHSLPVLLPILASNAHVFSTSLQCFAGLDHSRTLGSFAFTSGHHSK